MDTQSTDASVQNEIRITEPYLQVLSTPIDDGIGSASTDPEDDAESISSIEIQAGIKPCCSRCGTDSYTEVQCTASSGRNAIKRKSSDGEDSKSSKISIKKRKNFKRFRQDLHQVVIEGKRTDDLQ